MKTNNKFNTSEVRPEQATNAQYETIYLGVDLHKASIMVTRIIEHSTPQPAQRFTWERFWDFVRRQCRLAKTVHAVYEAGAFGFWVYRELQRLGVQCVVAHPEKLDRHHKGVQTDKLDSRELADKLHRYVLGNTRALVKVYVPTQAEERQRLDARHRRTLNRDLLALKARGRGLLLSQGVFLTQGWWLEERWKELQAGLCPEVIAVLADTRSLLLEYAKHLAAVEKKLQASAPKELPKGFGRLSFVLLLRELCNYQRFQNRRNIGGFTGLCGGVSSSGPYHLDLSINKAGSAYLRTLLIELAWRVVYWQPRYTGRKVWQRFCGNSLPSSKRRRKIAIVALARQLAVDLWRWQTGQVTAEQLGFQMVAAT